MYSSAIYYSNVGNKVVHTSIVYHPLPSFYCSLVFIRDKYSLVPIRRPGYKTEIESSGKRGRDGGD